MCCPRVGGKDEKRTRKEEERHAREAAKRKSVVLLDSPRVVLRGPENRRSTSGAEERKLKHQNPRRVEA